MTIETIEREFGGYPESCIRQGHFQLEGEQVMAIVTELFEALDSAEGKISNSPPPPCFEVVAYRREWEGDISDVGKWIYEDDINELDEPLGRWQALYAPTAPKAPNGR